ncbi:hypothetical protein VCHA48O428_20176 [Vibrio chagasii]|nr:hypothetical protein VCHA43P273_180058 [Vibrio chagasii]CAH7216915.1 hypothetical protein VCHA48O428_20176 [Vibrio chagasii]
MPFVTLIVNQYKKQLKNNKLKYNSGTSIVYANRRVSHPSMNLYAFFKMAFPSRFSIFINYIYIRFSQKQKKALS